MNYMEIFIENIISWKHISMILTRTYVTQNKGFPHLSNMQRPPKPAISANTHYCLPQKGRYMTPKIDIPYDSTIRKKHMNNDFDGFWGSKVCYPFAVLTCTLRLPCQEWSWPRCFGCRGRTKNKTNRNSILK